MTTPGAVAHSPTVGVLVLHGFTAQPQTVAHLGPHLERAGFRHRIPALRGHGTHHRDLQGVRWEDWYDDASAAYRELAAEHEAVAVVGHSVGGLVAGLLAAREPGVAALVLVAPALEFSNPWVKLLPVLGRVVREWKSGPTSVADPELRSAVAGLNYGRFPVSAFAEALELSRLAPLEFPRVRCPVLVIHPRRDTVIPPRAAEEAYRRLGSQEKRLVWLERTDHEVFWDAERDAVSATIAEFIAAALEPRAVKGAP